MEKLMSFITQLRQKNIYHTISSNDSESVSVLVVLPGEYWDVQFQADGEVGVEIFKSDGKIRPESELQALLQRAD